MIMGKFLAFEDFPAEDPIFVPEGIDGSLKSWMPVRAEELAGKWLLFIELNYVDGESVGIKLNEDSIKIKATLLGDFWRPGLSGFSHHQGELNIPLPGNANPAAVTAHHFKDLLTIEIEKLTKRSKRSVAVSHSWSATRI